MTTITYREGMAAADTALTADGHLWPLSANKLWGKPFVNADVIFAVVGSAHIVLPLLSSLQNNVSAFLPSTDDLSNLRHEDAGEDDELLRFTRYADKTIQLTVFPVNTMRGWTNTIKPSDFTAFGSGAQYALGSMAAGSSAVTAIRHAALYDTATSSNVMWIEFNKTERGIIT